MIHIIWYKNAYVHKKKKMSIYKYARGENVAFQVMTFHSESTHIQIKL